MSIELSYSNIKYVLNFLTDTVRLCFIISYARQCQNGQLSLFGKHKDHTVLFMHNLALQK